MHEKVFRKTLSVLISLFLLFGLIPASVIAADLPEEAMETDTVFVASAPTEEAETTPAVPEETVAETSQEAVEEFAGEVPTEPVNDGSGEPAGDFSGEAPTETTGDEPGEMPTETTGDVTGETGDDGSGETPTEPAGDVTGETGDDGSGETPTEPVGDVSGETIEDGSEEITEDGSEETSEDESDETEEETEEDETGLETAEVNYPAFSEDRIVGGVKVSVTAPEGVFPEGTSLSVKELQRAEQQKVDTVLDQVRESDENVAVSYTFDITALDQDGEEVQPADGGKVSVSFHLAAVEDDNLETRVYHIEDKSVISELDVQEMQVQTTGDVATVETTGFSYYTVEFTYNNLQYVMPGDESIPLADILAEVGLTGEVTAVSVSNEELFSVALSDGSWIVTAHQSFTSEEWMKVTIDGIEYEIVVTDTIPGSMVTSVVDMNSGQTKTGDFTIGNNGVVRGPTSGTATIKNGIVTNKANNGSKGGVNASNGSAFIARGANSLKFDGVTINSDPKILVFNIWAGASITANNTVLDGQGNDWGGVPFLLVGAYPGGVNGTLNFTGTSEIKNTINGKISGGNNGSVINVNSGTLTISNSQIEFEYGTRIVVNKGATLALKDVKLTNAQITVNNGGTLTLEGTNTFTDTTISNAGQVLVNGTAAEIKDSSLTISGNGTVKVENGKTLTIDPTTLKLSETIVVENGAMLVVEDTELDVSSNTGKTSIQVNAGGKLIFKNSSIKNANGPFGSGIIVSNGGNIEIEDSTFENITKTSGDSSIIEVKGDGNLSIKNSAFKNNTDSNAKGGIILMNNAGNLTIEGTTFENNKSGNGNIYAGNSGNVDITNSTFKSNVGGTYGGMFFLENVSALTIDDASVFTENNARFGGAIYMNNVGSATIGTAKFERNGNVYELPSGANPNFKYWDACDGGALYLSNSPATLNGTVFDANEVWGNNSSSGGAVYAKGGGTLLDVNGAKFTNNCATMYGGAMTVAHGATAYMQDLGGDPTEFKGNYVSGGFDQAGGGLFINLGYVKMIDAAIYNNYASDAGGGLSTCTTGTAQVRVLDGSAIFDNHVIDGNFPDADIMSYQDVYFQTVDHKDAGTGETIPGRDSFPAYNYELYERMYNGGLHNWSTKPLIGTNDGGSSINSLIAASNPTNRDISGAKVIFTENVALNYATMDPSCAGQFVVSGGAIGCNGLLEIGTSVEIKILKVWDDESDHDGVRPTEAEFRQLIADGKLIINDPTGNPVNLNAAGIQIDVVNAQDYDPSSNVAVGSTDNQTIRELIEEHPEDVYMIVISGLAIPGEYTVVSDEVEMYESSVDESVSKRVITNKHEKELIDIPVSKEWDDADNQDGKRPESITINLLADGEPIESKTITVTDDWKWMFTGLDKYRDGKEIVYTITEDAVEDYTTTIDGYNITNSYTPGKVSVEGSKTWDDADNQDGKRPLSITINLFADGEKVASKTVTEADGWKWSFTDLDKYKDGKEIVYRITEDAVESYTAKIDGYNITNSYTPDKVSVAGSKTWDDVDNKDGKRPKSITINLLADGEKIDSKTVTEADGWKWSFTGLEKNKDGKEIVYTITEDAVEGYTATINGYNVTNKYVPKPNSPAGPSKTPTAPRTGDDSHLGLWIALLALSSMGLCALIVVSIKRRRGSKY